MIISDILETREPIFYTEKGSMYIVHSDGTTTRFKKARAEHPGEEGQQPRSQFTFYLSKEEIDDKLSIFQAEGIGVKVMVPIKDGWYGIKYVTGKDKDKFIRNSLVKPALTPSIGLCPIELFKNGHFVHFGNKITKIS